jgi:ribosomal protein S11
MTADEHNEEALTLRLREILAARAAEKQRAAERDALFQEARNTVMRALYARRIRISQIANITGLTQGGVSAIVRPYPLRRARKAS